jgi:DNA gyrase subunit A
MGRSAQGVRILSIDKPDFVIGVDRIVREEVAREIVQENTENTENTDDMAGSDDMAGLDDTAGPDPADED